MPTERDIPIMKRSYPNSNTLLGIVCLCCMMPSKWVFLWIASTKSPKSICGFCASMKSFTILNSRFLNTISGIFRNHFFWKPNKKALQIDKSHICWNVWKVRSTRWEMKWAWSAFINSSTLVLLSFRHKRPTIILLSKMRFKSRVVKSLLPTKVSIQAEKKLLFWDQVPIESVRG